jgi:DNA-binding protein HU-beta
MNKSQLVEIIAKKTSCPKVHAEKFLDALLESIKDAIQNGDEVKLVGFGSFTRQSRKAKVGRNPKSGEKVEIPATTIPHFKAGKEFKDLLK